MKLREKSKEKKTKICLANINNNIIIIIYSIYRALIPNGPKALYIIK